LGKSVEKTIKDQAEDPDIVAKTLWGEARGEGVDGMKAVLSVIATRANIAKAYKNRTGRDHAMYGNGTLAGACLRPWQFSCWLESDPNRAKLMTDIEDAAMRTIRGLVAEYFANPSTDTTGPTHYLTRALFNSPACPKWAKKMQKVREVGNHILFRE
jgi:hypothetical protein